MSKLEIETVEETVMVPQVVVKKKFILELDQLEVEVLHLILDNIGGHPSNTLRGVTDQINREFIKMVVSREINVLSPNNIDRVMSNYGSLYFAHTDGPIYENW